MTKATVVDHLVVHQIDVAHPVPGGIDGVIRGMLRFAPVEEEFAVVGVIARPSPGRRPGRWELHRVGGRVVRFLPVAVLDASDQSRKVPHSVRLAAGLARYRSALPEAALVHVHRADVAWAVARLLPRARRLYFVHTQENGLTSGATDSFWRRAPQVHAAMERSAIDTAASVVVFNPDYARALSAARDHVAFSPNWYEPDLIRLEPTPANPWRLVWLGRVEPPKDPALAIEVFVELCRVDPDHPWELALVGSGTLEGDLRTRVAQLPDPIARRVRLTGALGPEEVAETLRGSGVFLMTSVPGYEGHPRVLIEALGCGLPAVVTEGSDTGDLVHDGVNGYVRGRDAAGLAEAVLAARRLDRSAARQSAEPYSAPEVVARILRFARRPRRQPTVVSVDRLGQARIDGTPLFHGDLDALVAHLATQIPTSQVRTLVTPNTDFLVLADEHDAMARALRDADVLIADGAPIVALARMLGARGLQRLTGADLLPAVAAAAPERGWTIAITGGAPGIAERACAALNRQFGTDARAIDFPRISSADDPACHPVVTALREMAPDIVFVCLGAPKQEAWVEAWRDELPPALYVGAGAAVDFVAGARRRAPRPLQLLGLEWLYRLVQEPQRLAYRYLVRDPRFTRVVRRSLAHRRRPR